MKKHMHRVSMKLYKKDGGSVEDINGSTSKEHQCEQEDGKGNSCGKLATQQRRVYGEDDSPLYWVCDKHAEEYDSTYSALATEQGEQEKYIIQYWTSLLHGEGWTTLVPSDYEKVLLGVIRQEINIADLRIIQICGIRDTIL
jgi:hypothetical protein